MNAYKMLIPSVLLVGAVAAMADGGKVNVEYINADKFTDVKDRQFKSAPEKNQNLIGLKSWFEKRAVDWVAYGQQLKMQFNDIDLAGDYEPWQMSQLSEVRIVKDLYPPKMKFHFQLIGADNAVIREGDRELRDLSFMMSSDSNSSESMRYEKKMLENWLRDEFPKP